VQRVSLSLPSLVLGRRGGDFVDKLSGNSSGAPLVVARTVPIPEVVSGELADYKALQLVFPSASGTPLRNRNWRRDVLTPRSKRSA
jgi:hypothetical protein